MYEALILLVKKRERERERQRAGERTARNEAMLPPAKQSA